MSSSVTWPLSLRVDSSGSRREYSTSTGKLSTSFSRATSAAKSWIRPATPLSRLIGAVKRATSAWKATSSPIEMCPSTARRPPIHRISALLRVARVGATTARYALGTPRRCCTSSVVACWPAQRRKKPFSPPVAFMVSIS